MTDRRFVNPKGGYFVEDARGRLRDAPRHNPDNLHIGESWYGGPLAKQGNPRVDGDNTFNAGWKKGWGEIKDNWDSGRKGLEDWRRKQEGPNTMIPLAYNNDLPWMTVGEIDRDGGTEAWKRYSAGDPRYKWDPKRTPKVIQPRLDNTGAYSSTQLASAPHGYSTDNFYNPNDDQYYNDYEDDYHDNPMRDDYFVQDPFSDIWGNQGGPLYFG